MSFTRRKNLMNLRRGKSEWIKKTSKVFDLHNSRGFWHHIIYWKFSSKKIAPLMLPTPPFVAVLEHLGNDGYGNWVSALLQLLPFLSSINDIVVLVNTLGVWKLSINRYYCPKLWSIYWYIVKLQNAVPLHKALDLSSKMSLAQFGTKCFLVQLTLYSWIQVWDHRKKTYPNCFNVGRFLHLKNFYTSKLQTSSMYNALCGNST